jgi:hypothetical protein
VLLREKISFLEVWAEARKTDTDNNRMHLPQATSVRTERFHDEEIKICQQHG